MSIHPAFDRDENRFLLVVGARKTMRNAGIGGVIWGVLNLIIGFFAAKVNPLNSGLLLLGAIMFAAGAYTLLRPSLNALLIEAIVSSLLFIWNIAISIINGMHSVTFHANLHGMILPAIAAAALLNQYIKLGHLKDLIRNTDQSAISNATAACKDLFREKVKANPDIAEATSKRCRVRILGGSVFCAQRNLSRAFHMELDTFRACIEDPTRKALKFSVNHPLGTVRYAFDKKNSQKLKAWLDSGASVPPAS